MRAALIASAAVIGLLGAPLSSHAAPSAPQALVTSPAPEFLQVRGGCGPGYHPRSWRDRWGYWRTRCVPYRRW